MRFAVCSTAVTILLSLVNCCHGNPSRFAPPNSPDIPSKVYTCSASYINHINTHINSSSIAFTSSTDISSVINSFIEVLCSSSNTYGEDIVQCLQKELPYSSFPVDSLVKEAFNLSTLSLILDQGCTLQSEITNGMECVIKNLMLRPLSVTCVTDVERFFTSLIALGVTHTQTHHLHEFCRIWGTMISCVSPYLGICSERMSSTWEKLGSLILTENCRSLAFYMSAEALVMEESSQDMWRLFNSNSSAVAQCAEEFSRDMIHFMPISIFNHSLNPGEAVAAYESVCRNEIYPYMYCLDERRLNVSSLVDDFMFQIVSTVNLRMSYNNLCSKIHVLKENLQCLVNAKMELSTCSCYISDLLTQISDLSSNFSYDDLVDPFCGFYSSFAECYVGLLGMCNLDLGILMEDVYLGPLTSTCQKARAVPCLPINLYAGTNMSGVIKCGEPVSAFLTNLTASLGNISVDLEFEEMMENMYKMVIDTYEYTCSIGDQLLHCIEDVFVWSQNPLDKLLIIMFDVDQFQSILKEGCQPSLIKDVKHKLKFIFSTLHMDLSTIYCINAMSTFEKVLTGEVEVGDPNVTELYCRIWSDFSECVEEKVSCSSPALAEEWQHFTMDILTGHCHAHALSQEQSNLYGPGCDLDPIDYSGMSICGMTYMRGYIARNSERDFESRLSSMTFLEEINHSCEGDGAAAIQMLKCLRGLVPASFLTLDRIVIQVFDLMTRPVLETVLDKACDLQPDLERHMSCIVEALGKDNVGQDCIQHLQKGFNITTNNYTDIQPLVADACSSWDDFVQCVDHHIYSCDLRLSWKWRHLSHDMLSKACKMQLAPRLKGDSCGTQPQTWVTLASLLLLALSF